MRKVLCLSILLLLMPGLAQTGVSAEKVLRVSDGKIISFDQMVADLAKVSVVFVGEVHDVAEHHRAQLNIIRGVHESDKPTAIGLEMFRADSQTALDSWVSGKSSLEQFLPVYYDNWRMPWPLYGDIFKYARENRISLAGLNIPEGISKKIAQRGLASLSPDEKKQLPPGISCNVDPTYMEFIRKAYGNHSAHGRSFVNFCEAQMVWDKSMAWHITGQLKKNPDRTVVVLAGIGHAWKRGIPEQLAEFKNMTYRVVLPVIPDQVNRETITIGDADYLLLE